MEKNDLISRKYLYDKMLEKEELARQRVLDTPTHSPAYLRYVAQLNERTALKHEIADAPDVTDTNIGSKWIPCSERLPENYETVNVTWVNRKPESYYKHIKDKPFTGTAVYHYGKWYWYSCVCEDYLREFGDSTCDRMDKDIEVIAWMPLPEPYKGEQHETN